jgi:chaperonin GroEL (HSP60 family)
MYMLLLFPQTNFEVRNEDDFAKLLQQEEEAVRQMCDDIIAVKPTLVITEKGVSGMCPFSDQWRIMHGLAAMIGE